MDEKTSFWAEYCKLHLLPSCKLQRVKTAPPCIVDLHGVRFAQDEPSFPILLPSPGRSVPVDRSCVLLYSAAPSVVRVIGKAQMCLCCQVLVSHGVQRRQKTAIIFTLFPLSYT